MDTRRLHKLRLDHPKGEEYPPHKRRWPWLVLLLIVLGLGFAAYKFWSRSGQNPKSEPVLTSSTPAAPAQSAVPPSSTGTFTAAGYLEPIPPYPVTVSALVAGRIDRFDILEGTPVKAGQVIGKLNSSQFEQQLNELKAQAAVLDVKLTQADRLLSRTEELAKIGSASVKELDQIKADASIAQAEKQRIAVAIDRVQWQINSTQVKAPVDGVVFERLKSVGETVSPDSGDKNGAALLTLYDPTKIQAWVDVTQRDAARVQVGQRVDLSLDADPGKTYEGRVIRIQPRASLQKNTVQVKVSIANPSPTLRPDMSVKVTFQNEQSPQLTEKPAEP